MVGSRYLYQQLYPKLTDGGKIIFDCSSPWNCCWSSSSVSDPDPDWIRIQSGLWIRIRIGNPDPDPGARKVAKIKIKNNKVTFVVVPITFNAVTYPCSCSLISYRHLSLLKCSNLILFSIFFRYMSDTGTLTENELWRLHTRLPN